MNKQQALEIAAQIWKESEAANFIPYHNLEDKIAEMILREVERHTPLVIAAQHFIEKCDEGRAHSIRSYAEFKAALALLSQEESCK